MPNSSTHAVRASAAPTRRRAKVDAVKLLRADHAEVKKLFVQYGKLVKAEAPDAARSACAAEICRKLTVHATIEEEIFYPAARDALGEKADLVDEADIEHATAKDLIAQLEGSDPADDHYDAKVKVLGEYIDHHVQEEQDEMFPKLKGKLDMAMLGEQLQERKHDLLAQLDAAH